MPRQSATFALDGGPLSVVVENHHFNQALYDLTLLERNEVDLAHRFPRSALRRPGDNTHPLPGAPAKHNGRVLDCVVALGVLDPSKAFAVFMKVHQDGREIGRVAATGTATDVSHTVELILELQAATKS
ncbi:MAG: hypothetical protein ACRENU_08665 [Gemmatimonadaceae bacterium]